MWEVYDLFHTGVKCPGGAPHKFGGHDAPGYPPLYLGPSWGVFSKKNKKSKTWILLTNAMQLPGGSAPRTPRPNFGPFFLFLKKVEF